MRSSRLPVVLAGALCLCWLTLTTGYAAAASLAPDAPVDLGGQPLPGDGSASTDGANPVPLTAGLWSDTLGSNTTTQTHFFSYQRRIENSTVHVGVIGAPQSGESDGVSLDVLVPNETGDATSCGRDNQSTESWVRYAVIGAQVAVGPKEPDTTDADCVRARTLLLAVGRGFSSNPTEMPVAIKIVEEAPVSGAADLPAPQEEIDFTLPEPSGSPVENPGAASFDEAPQLDASGTGTSIRTTVTEGTEQLWRVGVDWGQQVVVRAQLPEADPATVEEVGCCSGVRTTLRLVEPNRNTFAHYRDSVEDESNEGQYAGSDGAADELVAGTRPLAYRNRFDDTLPVLPGDYWISVTVAPLDESRDRDPIDVPVDLTVAVLGDVTGEPSYREAVAAPGGAAGPDGYSPAEPFLVGEDTFSAVASGNPVGAGDEAGWLGPRRWAGLGLGVLSVACLAGGVWRLRAGR